jgi:hypothetical protein
MNSYIMPPPQQQQQTQPSAWANFVWLVALLWLVAGIAGFVYSIMCFGKSGTLGYKVIGILIAVLFGPFFWIYLLSVKKYCR